MRTNFCFFPQQLFPCHIHVNAHTIHTNQKTQQKETFNNEAGFQDGDQRLSRLGVLNTDIISRSGEKAEGWRRRREEKETIDILKKKKKESSSKEVLRQLILSHFLF